MEMQGPFLICSMQSVIHVAVPMDTDGWPYFDFQKCKDIAVMSLY